jgi:hypothetical protein
MQVTELIMTILVTLNAGDRTYNDTTCDITYNNTTCDITYNDTTYNINKCNITYIFVCLLT